MTDLIALAEKCGAEAREGMVWFTDAGIEAFAAALAREQEAGEGFALRSVRSLVRSYWQGADAQKTLAGIDRVLAREQEAQPAYPEGEVVGPCVCGSWPGGKCLKCRWIPAAQPVPTDWRELLRQSEDNFTRQFGISVAAAWAYRDMEDLLAAQPAAQEPSDEQIVDLACRTLTRWEQDPIKFARAVLALRAQPAAQEPDELLREWIEAIGVNPELNRWHVSREDVLQLIRAARSRP